MDMHPMWFQSLHHEETPWPEIYCFHGHLTPATAAVHPINLGERTTSVLCAFDLPWSKTPTQFLSLIHLLCGWDEERLSCQGLVLVSLKPSVLLWEALFRWVTKRWSSGRSLSGVRGKDSNKLVPCIPPPALLVPAPFLGICCHNYLSFLLPLTVNVTDGPYMDSVISSCGLSSIRSMLKSPLGGFLKERNFYWFRGSVPCPAVCPLSPWSWSKIIPGFPSNTRVLMALVEQRNFIGLSS